tara:strand:+ start:772 stop:2736 length:1965 start_codon:yes stop_codon:yes gene_type:complete
MSLLITSSSLGAKETNQIGISVPYQYRNHLKNPLIIKPLSEIAIESVKINRVPQLDYGGGAVTNLWFGERLTADSLDTSLSYFIPCENTINGGSSPLDFSEKFKKILQENYSCHPELDSQNITVSIVTAASGEFTGFQYKIPGSLPSPTSTVPPNGTRTQENTIQGDGILDWDGTDFTAAGDNTFGQLMPINAQGGPISLNNGSMTYNNFDTGSGPWTVGMSRPIGAVFNTLLDPVIGPMAEIDSQDQSVLFGETGNNDGIGPYDQAFFDYAAEDNGDGLLRLYHAVQDTGAAGGQGLRTVMEEIIYYQNNDSAFTANNASNSSFATGNPIPSASITDITFLCNGESVEIHASGNRVTSCSLVNASTKSQVPKPIGQTCWKMYPTVNLWSDADGVELAVYECRDNTSIYNNQPENCWVTRSTIPTLLGNGVGSDHYDELDSGTTMTPPWNNAMRWPNSVDQRPAYQILDALSANTSATVIRDRKIMSGSSVGGISTGYENIFIMGPSERYMPRQIQEWQPNTMELLGFNPFAINPNSGMILGFGASFASTVKPSMMSQQSTFIRVPTLTHETYNFGTGNPSKILFQVPRFDNSGVETGALFFQNPDKTFVDLNNTTELRVTDLDIHFVRKDETFAKDLTGSSEVVFVVRKKSRM